MSKIIVWDPGHGGDDSGAQFDGVLEKDITLDIVMRTVRILRPCNRIRCLTTRVSDVTMPLPARTNFANSAHADYFVSVHTNADPDEDKPGMPEARGEEIWIDNMGKQDLPLATALMRSITLEFPDEPWRGIRQRDLWVVAKTNMPASLVEVAFIDNSTSNRKLKDPLVREQIAFALAEGVLSL